MAFFNGESGSCEARMRRLRAASALRGAGPAGSGSDCLGGLAVGVGSGAGGEIGDGFDSGLEDGGVGVFGMEALAVGLVQDTLIQILIPGLYPAVHVMIILIIATIKCLLTHSLHNTLLSYLYPTK